MYNISGDGFSISKLPIGETLSGILKLIRSITSQNASSDLMNLLVNVQRFLGKAENPQRSVFLFFSSSSITTTNTTTPNHSLFEKKLQYVPEFI